MKFNLLIQTLQKQIRGTCLKLFPEAVITIATVSLASTGLMVVLQSFGKLEPLELIAYDRMVQLRGHRQTDERLLIVGQTESDLETLKDTPKDRVLSEVMAILQRHNPRVIGLDIHRHIPQSDGWDELLTQMQAENVVVITKLGDSDNIPLPPPPDIDSNRVGANDLLVDPDGVVRRALLFGDTEDDTTYFSFALQTVFQFLAKENIFPQGSDRDPEILQLGEAVFVPLEKGEGGYHQIDQGGYQILLNYRGEDDVAEHVSFTDILNQDFDPALLNDRIVIIGSTAPSLKDLFFTPYSSARPTDYKMTGVEIHSQIISQILDAALGDRALFWFWPEWVEIVWMLGWAIAASIIAWFIRRPILLGLSTVVLVCALVGISYGAFLKAGWIPIVTPALTVLLSTGALVTYRAQQAQKQQQVVMTLLGQSTSPEIADALWESRDRLLKSGKLPGQRLIATMMFSDIKGFSTLAEKLPPEDLMDWINDYLNEMVDVVKDHQGIINKFTGDGLLAVFGVPVPRTTAEEIAEEAQRAVRCALEMGDRLEQLNQTWASQAKATAKMRIGIFTGPVVVGSLGGKERLEYGVMGDSVNTAARLESCLKDRHPGICRILIARETLDYLGDRFRVEPWGAIELKGKEQLADVYRVIKHCPATDSESHP